jgi:hypothetical protein
VVISFHFWLSESPQDFRSSESVLLWNRTNTEQIRSFRGFPRFDPPSLMTLTVVKEIIALVRLRDLDTTYVVKLRIYCVSIPTLPLPLTMRPTAFALFFCHLLCSLCLTTGHTVGSDTEAPEATLCVYDRRSTLERRADGDGGGDATVGVDVSPPPPKPSRLTLFSSCQVSD